MCVLQNKFRQFFEFTIIMFIYFRQYFFCGWKKYQQNPLPGNRVWFTDRILKTLPRQKSISKQLILLRVRGTAAGKTEEEIANDQIRVIHLWGIIVTCRLAAGLSVGKRSKSTVVLLTSLVYFYLDSGYTGVFGAKRPKASWMRKFLRKIFTTLNQFV